MDQEHPRHDASAFEHAIRDGYAKVDHAIGRILDCVDDDTVVLVMSDHGFGPLHAIVNLNNYLIQCGLLKLKDDWVTRLKAFAFYHGITPATVFRWLSRLGIQNLVARVSKGTRNKVMGKFLSYDSVDWSQTVAYSMGHVGQIYLNIAGREPHGIVNRDNRPEILQRVMDALQDLHDENGRPLVTKLIPRKETYHGRHAEHGPDLHVVLDDYNMISFPLFATNGQVITQQIRGDSGCHRSEGVLIASGAGIRQGMTVDGANLMDLAPTILHLAGLPVRSEMDGRVLAEIFEVEPQVRFSDDQSESREMAELSQDESDELEERLRGLGYL